MELMANIVIPIGCTKQREQMSTQINWYGWEMHLQQIERTEDDTYEITQLQHYLVIVPKQSGMEGQEGTPLTLKLTLKSTARKAQNSTIMVQHSNIDAWLVGDHIPSIGRKLLPAVAPAKSAAQEEIVFHFSMMPRKHWSQVYLATIHLPYPFYESSPSMQQLRDKLVL
jgi:hypothetical protein